MAKQKSGLGRGLNALFDDSSLNPTQTNHANTSVSKSEEINSEVEKKKQSSLQKEANTDVSRETSKTVSSNTSSSKVSSDIYISEDALENAKVVSREARPKAANQESARQERKPKSFFQHKSSQAINNSTQRVSASQIADNRLQGTKASVSSASNRVVKDQPSAKQVPAAKPAPIDTKPKDEKGTTGVVPLEKVQPNPDQPRTNFKPEEIEELANSIKKEGLLQPILVRKVGDYYQIIAGERRWQACKSLSMKEIPVRFWAADNDKALELALIENIQRSDLNPIEEAYGYKRLMERKGMTQSEVAQTVSKGRSTIANALRLLDLPEEAQQLLFEEKITAGHARAILSIPDAEGRKTLTNKLINEKLSVRETEQIARLLSGRAQAQEKGSSKRIPAPASFKKAARGLTRFLSVPVKVKTVQGKNKIEIQFKDEEELERILRLISENSAVKDSQKADS